MNGGVRPGQMRNSLKADRVFRVNDPTSTRKAPNLPWFHFDERFQDSRFFERNFSEW